MSGCPFKKCGEPLYAKGLCVGHYEQQRRHPDRPLRPLHQRRSGVAFGVRLSPKALYVIKRRSSRAKKSPYAWLSEYIENALMRLGYET